jgi:hypothetical protein
MGSDARATLRLRGSMLRKVATIRHGVAALPAGAWAGGVDPSVLTQLVESLGDEASSGWPIHGWSFEGLEHAGVEL